MVMRFGEHQANGKWSKEKGICSYQELNPITMGWIEELEFNSQQRKRFFSTPRCPNQLSGPLGSYPKGTRGSFFEG